jgi:hypothetical protein
MQALSQLSYSPELVLRGPCYTDGLVVPCRAQAQIQHLMARDETDRQEPRRPSSAQ